MQWWNRRVNIIVVCKCIFFLCMSLTLACVHVCVCVSVCYTCMYICSICGRIFSVHKFIDTCIYIHVENWREPSQITVHLTHWGQVSQWNPELMDTEYLMARYSSLLSDHWNYSDATYGSPAHRDLQCSCGFWDPNSSPHMFTVRTLTTHQCLQLNCDFFYRRQ